MGHCYTRECDVRADRNLAQYDVTACCLMRWGSMPHFAVTESSTASRHTIIEDLATSWYVVV